MSLKSVTLSTSKLFPTQEFVSLSLDPRVTAASESSATWTRRNRRVLVRSSPYRARVKERTNYSMSTIRKQEGNTGGRVEGGIKGRRGQTIASRIRPGNNALVCLSSECDAAIRTGARFIVHPLFSLNHLFRRLISAHDEYRRRLLSGRFSARRNNPRYSAGNAVNRLINARRQGALKITLS